jgi:hypothetical protein
MSIQSNCAVHIVIYIVYIYKSNINNGKKIEIKWIYILNQIKKIYVRRKVRGNKILNGNYNQ